MTNPNLNLDGEEDGGNVNRSQRKELDCFQHRL